MWRGELREKLAGTIMLLAELAVTGWAMSSMTADPSRVEQNLDVPSVEEAAEFAPYQAARLATPRIGQC